MDYEVTIGLEIHCELKTNSKLFCSCPNAFGGEPNTRCCPVCAGLPGAMPTLNEKAVEYAIKAGLALGCEISKFSKWDRKNYFYPDLPKSWQTSQYDLPLCKNGALEYFSNSVKKSARINRIHLEEDAGKLIHTNGVTRVDYNRSGVPLIEIVTEPDFHSPEDAVAFLEELKSVLKYSGVSAVKMQEGNLRVDVNLSVAPTGGTLGTRTETKNLNSFRSVLRSCKWEAERQIELLERGEKIVQETRRWEDGANAGYGMRSKEEAHDYRFFPEPDLLPVAIDEKSIERIRASIPLLKRERIAKYLEYGLSQNDAEILTSDLVLSDLFDQTIELGADAKRTANLILTEVLRLAKEQGKEELHVKITPEQLYQSLLAVENGMVSLVVLGKEVLPRLWGSERNPLAIIETLGLRQNSDHASVESVVKSVVKANESVVEAYRAGNEKVFSFLVGQVMKSSKGKLNPKVVSEILKDILT